MDTPIGPPPPPRRALSAPPGYESETECAFGARFRFGSEKLSEHLLSKALELLDNGTEKTKVHVLHDLLEAQGLFAKSKPVDPDARKANDPALAILGNPALADALKALARGAMTEPVFEIIPNEDRNG